MKKFKELSSIAIPFMRSNVDTDAIIPSREIKGVSKTGLSDGLFANWRYKNVEKREIDSSFIFNKEILISSTSSHIAASSSIVLVILFPFGSSFFSKDISSVPRWYFSRI